MNKLLNVSTSIAAEKTVSEIQAKLAHAGTSQILHGYDDAGNVIQTLHLLTAFLELESAIRACGNSI